MSPKIRDEAALFRARMLVELLIDHCASAWPAENAQFPAAMIVKEHNKHAERVDFLAHEIYAALRALDAEDES